jgi:hypothetical protein
MEEKTFKDQQEECSPTSTDFFFYLDRTNHAKKTHDFLFVGGEGSRGICLRFGYW